MTCAMLQSSIMLLQTGVPVSPSLGTSLGKRRSVRHSPLPLPPPERRPLRALCTSSKMISRQGTSQKTSAAADDVDVCESSAAAAADAADADATLSARNVSYVENTKRAGDDCMRARRLRPLYTNTSRFMSTSRQWRAICSHQVAMSALLSTTSTRARGALG